MALNYFTFGDYQSLKDCGLYIEKRPARIKPMRDVTAHQIPGRDGDVYIDNGRWESVPQRYQVGCSNIDRNIDKINEMLCQPGMLRLSDSYDNTVYRKAICINSMEFTEDLLNFGHATIEFLCDPYRYLLAWDNTQVLSEGVITNPTAFEALPLFIITTTGQFTIHLNNKDYTFGNLSGLYYVDCEAMKIYRGRKNYNSVALFDEFPVLSPGENTISFTSTSTAANPYTVAIQPRWRKI